MDANTTGRARKKMDRRARAACPAHYYPRDDEQRALLAARLPAGGLPGRVRFLLGSGEWTVPVLAPRARLMPSAVRLLARGWRLPVGPGPRREVRRLVADLVCPGCIDDLRRQREEQEERDERRGRREVLRERRRAVGEARRREE